MHGIHPGLAVQRQQIFDQSAGVVKVILAGDVGRARLQRLRHGREQALLVAIAALAVPRGARGAIVRREQSYLAGHAARMPDAKVSARGRVGSGAVESACRQRQCRFKRPGQFWTANGLRNLCALDEARRNEHWDELWITA